MEKRVAEQEVIPACRQAGIKKHLSKGVMKISLSLKA